MPCAGQREQASNGDFLVPASLISMQLYARQTSYLLGNLTCQSEQKVLVAT